MDINVKVEVKVDIPQHTTQDEFMNILRENGLDSITKLDCSGCTQLTEIPLLPNLTTLGCSECTQLTEIPLLPNLTKLYCNGCTSLTEVPPLSTLTYLNCYGCTGLTEVPQLENLTTLGCSYCTGLVVVPSLPNLTELRCYGCPNLKISYCPKLKPNRIYTNISELKERYAETIIREQMLALHTFSKDSRNRKYLIGTGDFGVPREIAKMLLGPKYSYGSKKRKSRKSKKSKKRKSRNN